MMERLNRINKVDTRLHLHNVRYWPLADVGFCIAHVCF